MDNKPAVGRSVPIISLFIVDDPCCVGRRREDGLRAFRGADVAEEARS